MKRSAKIAVTTVSVIVVLLCAIYGVGVFYFSSHLFPSTKMGTEDVSLQSERQLTSEFNSVASNYSLDISGMGFSYKLTSSKIGMSVEANALASEALSHQDSMMWPLELFSSHDLSDLLNISYDEKSLKSIISNQVSIYNQDKKESQNATVVYDEDAEGYVVQPEVYGEQLSTKKVLAKVTEAIDSLEGECVLTDSEKAVPSITSDDERLKAAVEKGNQMIAGTINLVVGDDKSKVATIGKDEIVSWLSFDNKNLEPQIDSEALDKWVASTTEGLNTVGSKRTWKRADGTKCKVSGGSYGWKVDTSKLEDTITTNLKSGDYSDIELTSTKKAAVFAGKGKRDWKAYVDVDLSEQKVRYYDDNDKLKHECKCVTGTKGKHDTPEGVYTMDWRQSPRVLKGTNDNGTTYESKVTYWMPFIDARGIGLHDASWRSTFGGSIWKSSGSHGCVNLPPSEAKWFYQNLPTHVVVVVHK